MRFVTTLAILAAFAATTAEAQGKKVSITKAGRSGPAASASSKEGAVKAMAKTDAPTSASKEVAKEVKAAPEATTAAPVAEVAPAPTKKLGFNWVMINDVPVFDKDLGQMGEGTAYHSLRANYKLTPSTSARLAVEFDNGWGTDRNGKARFKFTDPYAQLANSALATLPADIKIAGFVRFYPAMSLATATNSYGTLRGGITLSKQLTDKLSIKLDNDSRVYAQRDLSRYNAEDKGLRPTALAKTKNWLGVGYDISKVVSISQDVGTTQIFFNEDNGLTRKREEYLYAETDLGFEIADNFSLTAYINIEESRNLLDQKDDISKDRFLFYRDVESTVGLVTSLKF